jgi:hypothetical protein
MTVALVRDPDRRRDIAIGGSHFFQLVPAKSNLGEAMAWSDQLSAVIRAGGFRNEGGDHAY